MSEKVKVSVVNGSKTEEFEGDFVFGITSTSEGEKLVTNAFAVGKSSNAAICQIISDSVSRVVSEMASDPMESVFMLEEIIRNIKKASSEALVNEVVKKYCSKEEAESEINKERQEK